MTRKNRPDTKVQPEDMPRVLELLKTHSMGEVAAMYGYEHPEGLRMLLRRRGIDPRQFARKKGNFTKARWHQDVEAVSGEIVTGSDGTKVVKCPLRYAAGVAIGPSAKPKGRK